MGADIVTTQVVEMARALRTRMSTVRNVVVIFSGKGGVGKSTIAATLALAMAESGRAVGLADADFGSPALHLIFDLSTGSRPVGPRGVLPWSGPYGLKIFSHGSLPTGAEPTDPVPAERDPGAVWMRAARRSMLREVLTDVHWGELDDLVIDLPPGAEVPGDLAALLGAENFTTVAISTDSALAFASTRRSIRRIQSAGVQVQGFVVNMTRPRDDDDLPAVRWAHSELGVEFVASVPYDRRFGAGIEAGRPELILGQAPDVVAPIRDLAVWLESRCAAGAGSGIEGDAR